MKKRYYVFIISLLLNAFGNSLMLKGSAGAIPWTALYDNFSGFFKISPGTAGNIISIIFFIISKIIGRDFEIKKASLCILVTILYGFVTDFYLLIIGRDNLIFEPFNYILSISGALIVAFSVSLVIQANVGYLALDDFLKNLKIYTFKGNVTIATLSSFGIALFLSILFGYLSHDIKNVTILTIIISLSIGYVINFFDKICIIKFDD